MSSPARWLIATRTIALAIGISCSAEWLCAQNQPKLVPRPPNRTTWADQAKYKDGEIPVRFRPDATGERIAALHAMLRTQRAKFWKSVPGLQLVRLPGGTSVTDAIKAFRRSGAVLYAEPNWQVRIGVATH